MTSSRADSQPTNKSNAVHWPTALQFALSAVGVLFFWSASLGSALFGGMDIIQAAGDAQGLSAPFLSAAGLFALGLALLPSVWISLARILGRAAQPPAFLAKTGRRILKWLPFLTIVALALGGLASRNATSAWLALPLLHVVTVSLIIGGLVWLALRRLQPASPQRMWGSWASGITLAPLFSLILELLVGGLFFLVGVVYVMSRPSLLDAFQRVIDRASVTVTDPNQLLVELGPVFSDPVVLVLILGLVALAVPLIEELFKPIGVWMLLGRGLTPARGFVLGTLSGAGFALAESLAGGGIADGWLAITTARIGTSALHILTSGLMGWALVMAKSKGRYLLVVLTYLVSVSLHGLWNGMVIIGSFASLSIVAGANLLPLHLAVSSWLVLLVLAAGCIILLIFNNRTLRVAETSPGSV